MVKGYIYIMTKPGHISKMDFSGSQMRIFNIKTRYMAEIGSQSERDAFADYSRLFEKTENMTTEEIDAILYKV